MDAIAKRRPHSDWHLWRSTWRALLAVVEGEIRIQKRRKVRGQVRNPRRLGRLKAEARLLYRLRHLVRDRARVAAQAQVAARQEARHA